MPDDRQKRIESLKRLLTERILVVDGAMGTNIQAQNLTAADFGGEQYEGCNEYLCITKPEAIKKVHRDFLKAGADIIESNSFGSTPIVLNEYGLGERAREISRAAARIARECADEFSTPGKPRFVAGSIGPTNKSLSVTGGVTFDQLVEAFRIQAVGLIEGGSDLLLIETQQDSLNVKAALEGTDLACKESGVTLPIAVQATIETMGTILAGQDIEAFYTTIAHRDLLWVGLNCATGPEFMTDHIRTLAGISRFPIACIPNAGLPDEHGHYNETPEASAKVLGRFAESGWVNVLGGCCGMVPAHIERLAEVARRSRPHKTIAPHDTRVSGLETLIVNQETRPILVGERTNVLGSRAFKKLIAEGKWEEAAEVGRRQVRGGAHVVDVCLQDPDRNELADVTAFLDQITKKIKVPIMLDSTDHRVIEEGLKRTPGKSIINSVNLEDGEGRFQAVVPLARRYGAALIVGCIDEDKAQAQAITRERKLAIAQRSHKLLTEKYGVAPEDIIFDPLVFPVGTGDKNYIGAGVETIEGVRLIKEALPRCKTILGVSNVSFGLPAAGREVLNAVFLYHCVQAGLDMAIVNSEKLVRYPSIPENERKAAEDLIWWRGDDPVGAFAALFRDRKETAAGKPKSSLSLDERLSSYILEGSKDGLTADLDLALKERRPLDIINGPLMKGMDEVGRLFNENRLIVAEVLQSAEAMKAAVAHLEPHMEKSQSAGRGKILLATVKGDVHDIGKNLVEIILGNNGYQVVNLGIKVPPQQIIEAYHQHKPDAIGLSGLLVKSAQMMVETAQDLKAAGVACPILVGGAALTNKFTHLRIAPAYDGIVAYAKDAMDGLALANRVLDKGQQPKIKAQLDALSEEFRAADGAVKVAPTPGRPFAARSGAVRQDAPIPKPPDLKLHVLRNYDLNEIFSFINPMMLYVRHLGYKGRFPEALAQGEAKALELQKAVRKVEEAMLARKDIHADAVFKFFPAQADGQRLLIYAEPDGKRVLESFIFGRQSEGDLLSLVDYIAPRESGRMDYIVMFVTTVTGNVRALAEEWKNKGDFLASHILQVLALEGAEGFAELLHQQLRKAWGIGDPAGITKEALFKAHYQGKRYSFGYPACPRLEDQSQLFRLLDVSRQIQAHLTEGSMMDPESSVSAMVLHHPDAKYFNLAQRDVAELERELAAAKA